MNSTSSFTSVSRFTKRIIKKGTKYPKMKLNLHIAGVYDNVLNLFTENQFVVSVENLTEVVQVICHDNILSIVLPRLCE